MGQIKNLQTGQTITTAASPVWLAGIWECGDQRFVDPEKTLFAATSAYAPLTPMQFYLAFSPAERIAIKGSSDPVVKEFWATYELAAQMNSTIDPNLTSVQEGVNYLSVTNQNPANSPLTTYIAPARVAQILAGEAQ